MSSDYTNRSLPDWGRRWAQPVTFETVRSLSGSYLTDGRGILVWINSGQVRMATTSSPSDFLTDSVVTSASTLPIVDFKGLSCSVFRVGGDLFIHLADVVQADGRNAIFKANSAGNPTSWSLYATIDSHATSSGNYYDETDLYVPSVPRVDGSRWLLFVVYNPATNAHYRRSAIFRSTDDGQTWSVRTTYSTGGVGTGQNPGFQVPHIGKDPATGYFYHAGEFGSGGGGYEWKRSTDDGATWSVIDSGTASDSTDPNMGVWDDGSHMFGLDDTSQPASEDVGGVRVPEDVKVVRFDTVADPFDTTTVLTAAEYPHFGDERDRARLVQPLPGLGLVLFHWDRVIKLAVSGWRLGAVAF